MSITRKAKRYLEYKNLHETYWGKRIIAAEENGGFSDEDVELAGDYVTCACGKVTHDIPRSSETSIPYDNKIADLGLRFNTEVISEEPWEAAKILVEIELRARLIATIQN
jgi:hypothetical protein